MRGRRGRRGSKGRQAIHPTIGAHYSIRRQKLNWDPVCAGVSKGALVEDIKPSLVVKRSKKMKAFYIFFY